MILSTVPGGGYDWLSGTSMAAPHVAGVAALLLQANPNLSPADLDGILRDSAIPLGINPPNNDTGWGRVDAYQAGLAVTASGEIAGTVESASGFGLPNAFISATPLNGGPLITITTQLDGSYALALLPGIYNLRASAFAYQPKVIYSLQVFTGTAGQQDFGLNPEPLGSLFGRVESADAGQPISATLSLEAFSFSTQSDTGSGVYSMALPAGVWPLSVRAPGYRLSHITPTITAGSGIALNISLEPAPRILLVDSGYWYYHSRGFFYEELLDSLNYVYDTWAIRDPFGENGSAPDAPTYADLSPYDLVLWSAPSDSPGLIQINDEIEAYLAGGGHLILSGQHVAFWDGGGNLFVFPDYFPEYFGARFDQDDNFGPLTGAMGSILDGFSIALNTPDSDNSQLTPDEVEIIDPMLAEAILHWPDESVGGLIAGGCQGHQAAWLGFGLEGSGPLATRTALLSELIDWTETEPPTIGVSVRHETAILIGSAGQQLTETIWLDNTGTTTETFAIELDASGWPRDLVLPDSTILPAAGELELGACSGITVTARITVPMGLPRDFSVLATFRANSVLSPTVQAALSITAKTSAGLLLLDDGRWTKYGYLYDQALQDLGLAYDLRLQNGVALSDPAVLSSYPLVLWHTSNDWASPLTAAEELILADYLHGGGRLVFSTMDYLDVLGATEFAQEYFGIAGFERQQSVSRVIAAASSPLIRAFGTWQLIYPYLNWSDTLLPGPQTDVFLTDEYGRAIGLGRDGVKWRTAFFSFPLETLALPQRAELLSRALVWVSPLGNSRLEAPPVAALGGSFPITLTLGMAGTEPISNTRATLPIPNGPKVVGGSLSGPWTYDSGQNALRFSGVLTPGQSIPLGAELAISPTLTISGPVVLDAYLYAGHGYTLTERRPVLVDEPWLVTQIGSSANTLPHFNSLWYTVTVENRGVTTATIALTNTLPAQSQWVTSTLTVSSGSLVSQTQRLLWTASLAPGAAAELTYQVTIGFGDPVLGLVNRAEISASQQFWIVWRRVLTPGQIFLPFIQR